MKPVPAGVAGVRDRVRESARPAGDRDRAVAHGDHLRQAARLVARRNEDGVRARVDPARVEADRNAGGRSPAPGSRSPELAHTRARARGRRAEQRRTGRRRSSQRRHGGRRCRTPSPGVETRDDAPGAASGSPAARPPPPGAPSCSRRGARGSRRRTGSQDVRSVAGFQHFDVDPVQHPESRSARGRRDAVEPVPALGRRISRAYVGETVERTSALEDAERRAASPAPAPGEARERAARGQAVLAEESSGALRRVGKVVDREERRRCRGRTGSRAPRVREPVDRRARVPVVGVDDVRLPVERPAGHERREREEDELGPVLLDGAAVDPAVASGSAVP